MGSFLELSRSGIDFTSLLKRDDSEESLAPTDAVVASIASPSPLSATGYLSPKSVPTYSTGGGYVTPPRSPLLHNQQRITPDYLSKSLDPTSLLSGGGGGGHRRTSITTTGLPGDNTAAYDDHDQSSSAHAPLLQTHKSLSHLYHQHHHHRHPHSNSKMSSATDDTNVTRYRKHLQQQNGGMMMKKGGDVAMRAGGVQRMLSEDSSRRISYTRSMESVAQGALGSLLSVTSLEAGDYQVSECAPRPPRRAEPADLLAATRRCVHLFCFNTRGNLLICLHSA